jgi:hypothetical protein
MTKRAGKKKSPGRGGKTTGVTPVSQSVPKATGSDQKPDSFFWPELTKANQELAIAAGRGEQVKRIKDLRLELKAVNERWPIPSQLRERMVFEAAKIAMDPASGAKEKMWASRLLLAMDQINTRPQELPTQIQGNTITVNQILAVIEGQGQDDLDMRDRKVLPGSEDDYA